MDFRKTRVASLAEDVIAWRVSARELTQAALDNIGRLDGEINSFCAVDHEQALVDADEIDAAAQEDSELVRRLKAAGCVVLGKTNTPEFGHKGKTDNVPFGATLNPWNRAFTPGGSSGGSAAALAAGIIPLATGSDGGGSISGPSAICGLSGIKTDQPGRL